MGKRTAQKLFIIKAQRALYPANSSVLITTKDGGMCQQIPCEGAIDFAIGDRAKAYFEVSQNDDGVLALHREVKANW